MKELICVRENGEGTGDYTPHDKRDLVDKFNEDQAVLNKVYNFSVVFDLLAIIFVCLGMGAKAKQIPLVGYANEQLLKFALVCSGLIVVCAVLISICTVIKGFVLSWFVEKKGLNTCTKIYEFHDNNARYIRQYGDYMVMSDWDAVENFGGKGKEDYLLLDKEHAFVARRLTKGEYLGIINKRPKFIMFKAEDCEELDLIR